VASASAETLVLTLDRGRAAARVETDVPRRIGSLCEAAGVATARRYAPRLPPAERREQLLDAALDLIAREGYGGVTMEAVARAVGVTKPVVYDSFANRGELLRALLQREERRALRQLADVMGHVDPDIDPDVLLSDGVTGFLRAVRETPDTWRLILLPTEGTPDVVGDHVDQGRAAVVARLRELLDWTVQRGARRPGLDLELAAQSILALGEHGARLVLTDQKLYDPDRVGGFVSALLRGLDATPREG
jgi:AcrR family transcriptional regulator